MTRCTLLVLIAFLVPHTAAAQHAAQTQATFEGVSLDRPLFLCHPGDGTDRIVVAEQAGRVLIFENRADITDDDVHLMIDLRDITIAPGHRGQNEEGLLGIAFHPDFADNGQVFLHYSSANPKRNVLSRFTMADDGITLNADSEEVLLEVHQPFWNHNGGMIAFGPDGYLYIALGDGGSADDPRGNGQNLGTLLGKILRLDVDHEDTQRETKYAIPQDNPFIDRENARPEIYAYGLRNTWRFSFDRSDGTLWAGDVGQNLWEEINIIRSGFNYGWDLREGRHDFQIENQTENTGRLIGPVVEHPRDEAMSITGGYVYRGTAIPRIQGQYLYGDYERGNIWAIHFDGREVRQQVLLGQVPHIASFGEDRDGEVYICSFGDDANNPGDDAIYKFVPRQ